MSHNLKRVNFSDPDKYQKLVRHLDDNGKPGFESPFFCLNKHYTHKLSGITDWSGIPSAGKSYFVLEYLMSLSEKHGLRHGLYLPDLGTYYEIMEKLVKMQTGKDFSNKYGNKITEGELNNARVFIDYHFIILIKDNVRKGLTPEQFWEYVCDYRDNDGGLDTCLIDSWKNITQEGGERNRDLYLDRVLSYRNELAETYNKHFHTIAHPAKTEMEMGGKDKRRRVPTMYDIKGGGAWAANGKNVIIIDRPDRSSCVVDVYINKTKPENVGKEGSIINVINLDLRRGRYFELHDGRRYYSYEWESSRELLSMGVRDYDSMMVDVAKRNAREYMEEKEQENQIKLDINIKNPFEDGTNENFPF
jgi:hypothetical protein